MPYRFFFSYARENRDPLLNRFYDDLCTQVRLKKFHDSGQVGFLDSKDIQSGAPWRAELADALRTAKTFVAICSPDYVNSEYCGKEFHFFRERYRRYISARQPAKAPRLIQAVLWGAPSGSLHQALSDFQYTDDEYPPVYAKEGLRYMMALNDHDDDYKKFVVRLAHKLVDYSEEHTLPEEAGITLLDSLESAFAAQRDDAPQGDGASAWFLFVAGRPHEFPSERRSVDRYRNRGGKEWKPFAPVTSDTVGLIAQATASKYKLYFEELPLNDQIEAQIEAAEKRGELVIVLVDPWTLKIPGYRAWMSRLDRRNFDNCIVLITMNRPDPESDTHRSALAEIVKDTFRFKTLLRKTMYFRDSIASPSQLRSVILKSFAEFNNRTVEKRESQREIKDDRIRQEALAEGISLDKAPLVSSPGGPTV